MNTIQLIVILIFLGISGLSWAARKMQEKAAEREAEARRKRREEEYLRTGRAGEEGEGSTGTAARPVDSSDAQAKLRELAARRQAQLRELRQKQAGSAGSGPAALPTPQPEKPQTVRVEMWPGGPVFELGPAGQAAGSKPGKARPRPPTPVASAPVREQNRLGPATQQTPQQFAESTRKRQVKQAREAGEVAEFTARRQQTEDRATQRAKDARVAVADGAARTATRDRVARAEETERREVAGGAFRPPTTPGAWRNAIILGEVLGAPVGLRDQPHTH